MCMFYVHVHVHVRVHVHVLCFMCMCMCVCMCVCVCECMCTSRTPIRRQGIEKIAVLHLDGDLYTSTKEVLDALYDKVSPGGHVLVDDYYTWKGCRAAVDEFRRERAIASPILRVDWTGAAWVKEG